MTVTTRIFGAIGVITTVKGVPVLILTGKLPAFLPICLHIQAGDAAPPDHTLRIQFRNTAFNGAFKGVAAPDNSRPLGQ